MPSLLRFGDGEHFILFRILGWSRTEAFLIGTALIAASFIREFFRASRALSDALRPPQNSSPENFRKILGVLCPHLLLVIALSAYAFARVSNQLLGFIDGNYLLTILRNRLEFGDFGFWLSYNPLQGLGDLWYFVNPAWLPEFIVARFIHDPNTQRILIFTTCAVELFFVVFALSVWGNIRSNKASVGAWLSVLILLPFTYPSLIFNVAADAPHIVTMLSVPIIVTCVFFTIGTSSWLFDVLKATAIFLLVWYHFFAFGIFTSLSLPYICVGAFLSLFWGSRSQVLRKLLCASSLFLILAASGLPWLVYGVLKDSAFAAFARDLPPASASFYDGSILLRPSEPVGFVIGWLGLLSACYHATFHRGRLQWLAAGTSIYCLCILCASAIFVYGGIFGARPIYYEYSLWPLYAIFAALILGAPWTAVLRWVPTFYSTQNSRLFRFAYALLLVTIALLVHGHNHFKNIKNEQLTVVPPADSALTAYLRKEVGLHSGDTFRGRVVTLTGEETSGAATWEQSFHHDVDLIRNFKNDHRTIGLWYFNIPTLMEFSHTISSTLYGVVKNRLTYEGDPQVRNVLNMRRANLPLLRLLGVRFIITDSIYPAVGTRRILSVPMPWRNAALSLDEIRDPNLGFSPTEIVDATGVKALEWLDLNADQYEHKALVVGAISNSLTQAQHISIRVSDAGLRVSATSKAQALVVIPVQFSHCLQALSHNMATPEIRRVDGVLTGLLFSGNLDTTIRYRQGMFVNVTCRLNDFSDNMNSGIIR
jgi:hypothetical protein